MWISMVHERERDRRKVDDKKGANVRGSRVHNSAFPGLSNVGESSNPLVHLLNFCFFSIYLPVKY